MTRRHYLNLTNGLEDLDLVLALGEPWVISRIRSTTLEHADWWGLFMVDLDADLLLHLALGTPCVLHDRGTRRFLSKTLYFGAPLIQYVLERFWYGRVPASVPTVGPRGGRGPDVAAKFAEIYNELIEAPNHQAGQVRDRLGYFARYASCGHVRFEVAGGSTEHDGEMSHWVSRAAGLKSCAKSL